MKWVYIAKKDNTYHYLCSHCGEVKGVEYPDKLPHTGRKHTLQYYCDKCDNIEEYPVTKETKREISDSFEKVFKIRKELG